MIHGVIDWSKEISSNRELAKCKKWCLNISLFTDEYSWMDG